MPGITFDLTGKRFGRFVALSYTPGSRSNEGKWTCQCNCGNPAMVPSGNLRSGGTASCGCLKSEITTAKNLKHGGASSKLYQVWFSMKRRCLDSRNKRYGDYGGRGIKIHPEWINDFGKFRNYIQMNLVPRPSLKHSLDRINNDGNYEPGNLRWATPSEQNKNTRKRRHHVISN